MDLQQFKRKASRNKKALTAFLQRLDELVPEDMPALVAEADQEVWRQTDCTSCAHCCKTMTPTWSAEDIRLISTHLRMSPQAFKRRWLSRDPENGDWMNRSTPCQFLDLQTNRCTVYEVRPLDCREFPHHNKQPFDEYNQTFINNLPRCPATYELVARLKKKVERDYEWL
jgi:Fe-S-cluster containining protein